MHKGKILAVLIIVAVASVTPVINALIISNAKTSTPVAYVKVRDGQEFSITFTHSVNKRQVRDYIRVVDNKLVITKSEYDSFGAGMPENSADGAILSMSKDGKLELTGINLSLSEITLFVGTVAGHVLHINNRDYPLAELVPPGTPLQFKISRIGLLTLIQGRWLP